MQSTCVYQGCTGANVPGDYATIQAAVTALAPIGGTICLMSPSYTENVTGTGTKSLTIQGVSAASTAVTGDLTFNLPVQLQGFQVTGSATITGGPSTVANMVFVGGATEYAALNVNGVSGGPALDVEITASKILGTGTHVGFDLETTTPATITLDGVDLSAPQGIGIYFYYNSTLVLQNSYIHDAETGLFAESGDTITVVNNTFVNAGSALELDCIASFGSLQAITYENNLFVNNTTAVSITCPATQAATFASNGFFGNTTNFAGSAVEGTGDVKSDPLLQTSSTPPTLGTGSPARGAGNKAVAPATDYWGNARGTSVDLGCVQSP